MELVVKLPEGKRPFIGVLFDDYHQACNVNVDLIERHKDKDWQVIIEFKNGIATLKLISEHSQIVRVYNDVKYSEDKLRMWFHSTKNAKEFNFSQIHAGGNSGVVAKMDRIQKLFVLKLHSCIIWEK